jgi:biopolymer transport protein ExbD
MLDMAFQLLAFFILTYHPSDLEGQMQLALPADTNKAAHQKEQVDPTAANDKDPLPDIPADLTVVVKTQNDGAGAINELSVEDRAGPSAIHAPAGQSPADALLRYLRKAREKLENKGAIKLQADARLKWDNVVQVMDACRKAGFDNIAFVPPPDAGGH